jgi:hypothetical protein
VLEDPGPLRERYRELTEETLPAAADEDWPVQADHCCQRLVLDALFDDVWYDHVAGRPAFRHLTTDQLREAICIAESMVDDPERAAALQRASLRHREE